MDRILYLDMVKLLTIYLVILGHVLVMMIGGYQVGGRMISFIYSFHMPLFMLLSGYFVSSRSLGFPFIEFFLQKAKQLLLPAITCTAICCAYLFLCRENVNYRDEIIGNSWFLKTLFVYFVLFWLLKRTELNDWVLFAGSCAFLFVIPEGSTLQVNQLWPYFWGGHFLKKYHVLERLNGKWKYAIMFAIAYVGSYTLQRHLEVPNYIPINVSTIVTQGHFILLRYLVAFSGSMGVISLVALAFQSKTRGNMLNIVATFGKYTLGIYYLQTILVVNIFPDTLAWYVESEALLDLVIAPALSVGFLALCLGLIRVLSKNIILDLLFFGGQYNKR